MSAKEIRTSNQDTVCDVCGRTLLRGESADAYLDGAFRRAVCELCKDRALHEGWVREGTVTSLDDDGQSSAERRRSLLGRLRGRREGSAPNATPTLRDELDGHAWSESSAAELEGFDGHGGNREPRHVHAVPTSIGQKIISAASLFNDSEHRRTVAGVARSLGPPEVSIVPTESRPSLLCIVVSWELCWYRYEVELADEIPTVRVAGQGYELSELTPEERRANAVADEQGALVISG